SCTNTSNPRNVIAAALLARNANAKGLTRKPWVKSSLAPGSKAVELYLREANLLPELEKLGFGIVAFACTTCNGMSGALDPKIQQEIVDRDLYALAVLGDNITTDHLSPSNAILPDSAAGEYLAKMGLPEEDFNSYATHRGDHLTAQRATFANPTLVNEMAVVDGVVKKGSLARVEPDGKVMRMWEA
ncbi:Fe/S-dependent 2-methylisocitrate dehydratase AcnD, partial [Burkholderia cenocepacia]|nr:Fe/S-dependent 2-methylisocitrate dehydratase AcnD [Burkholderia cenocepacia]MDR5670934.1 Fe/S-dependent 2-methylisocitrate dehydratase AcnD [Burkholderia cenocepacia]